MANATWKHFERSPGYQRVKTSLRRLIGTELRVHIDIHVETIESGGWRFTAQELDQNSVVYSLGVGDDITFDLSIIEGFGAEVHAFDPTPSSIEMFSTANLPNRFHFHPWAITAKDGTLKFYPRVKKDGSQSTVMFTMIATDASSENAIEVPAYCLSSVASRLGHSRIDLLKMDIEGAEYEVLEGLLASSIKPSQLLVEFHHRFPAIGLEKTADMIGLLRKSGYKIFAVSDTGREVSFLHTAGH